MQPPVGINDDPGIWTLVTCTLQKCHISSSVQHVLKINLCSASRIHFPVDSLWIWFPWGSVPQLDSSLLMALRLLVCRTPSRTNTSVFSPILCRLPKAEKKKKKDSVWNSGHTKLWLVLLSMESHRCHQHCLLFGESLADKQDSPQARTLSFTGWRESWCAPQQSPP